jgi:hypothetical protein
MACVFTLGAVVGALLDRSRHRLLGNSSNSKGSKAVPVLSGHVGLNSAATPQWGLKALVVADDPEIVGAPGLTSEIVSLGTPASESLRILARSGD